MLVHKDNSFWSQRTKTFMSKYTKTLNSFFVGNKESVLEHIAPIYFYVYYVVVVLHVVSQMNAYL
jgi:hypothetical protein